MTQYNTLNIKLSAELNKLTLGIKNGTEVTLKMFLVILMIKIIFLIHCF